MTNKKRLTRCRSFLMTLWQLCELLTAVWFDVFSLAT